jgi:Holliday junction resolvasome RuvABC endonuclease subunit
MTDVILLALDLGTQTGWAIGPIDGKRVLLSGTESFALGRFDGGGMRGLRFQRWLEEMVPGTTGTTTQVAYEEVRRHVGVDAAHAYGGFQAILTAHCELRLVPYEGVPVGTIKKHLTGKGNANKSLMLAKARELGYRPADDNEADAIALWTLVQAQSARRTSPSSNGRSVISLRGR